jgi:hypothetical protein
MLKSGQITALAPAGVHSIPAVTTPQSERFLKPGLLQRAWFADQV